MKHTSLTLLCAALLSLSACGGGAKTETYNSSATMGQELVDLKKAYDEGILTKKEYKRAKRDITEMYDN